MVVEPGKFYRLGGGSAVKVARVEHGRVYFTQRLTQHIVRDMGLEKFTDMAEEVADWHPPEPASSAS